MPSMSLAVFDEQPVDTVLENLGVLADGVVTIGLPAAIASRTATDMASHSEG